jgi:hypothetical protein
VSHARFDELREHLLRAGIAPRHVRRYIAELRDHFDDLVREEIVGGAARNLAETRALARLGHDDDLAGAMLSRPELRSLTSRYPWAVFGLGPIAMLALSIVVALQIEVWLLDLTSYVAGNLMGIQPSPAAARRVTMAFTVYNALAVYGAPLAFAALLYRVGSRHRTPKAWIVTGVAIVCVLGGFQNLIFYDTGASHGGVLLVQSGLIPPFSHFAEGLARAVMNAVLVGAAYLLWLRPRLSVLQSHRGA